MSRPTIYTNGVYSVFVIGSIRYWITRRHGTRFAFGDKHADHWPAPGKEFIEFAVNLNGSVDLRLGSHSPTRLSTGLLTKEKAIEFLKKQRLKRNLEKTFNEE